MSRKVSTYKRSTLGDLISKLHKANPKVMEHERKISKQNKRNVVKQVNWTGKAVFKILE